MWVGADIIRPNAYSFINPQSRYARQLLFKGAKGQAILYKNRSEATLNYALRIANYTLYNRARANHFLNFLLFIFHYSLKSGKGGALPKFLIIHFSLFIENGTPMKTPHFIFPAFHLTPQNFYDMLIIVYLLNKQICLFMQ